MIHDGQFDLHVRLIYICVCVSELLTNATFAMQGWSLDWGQQGATHVQVCLMRPAADVSY